MTTDSTLFTEQNTTSDRAAPTKEKTKILMDTSPMSISIYNENLDIIDCNIKMATMVGLPATDEYLANNFRLMPPFQTNGRSSKKLLKELLQETFEMGTATHKFIFQNIDGVLVYTELTMVSVDFGYGDVVVVYAQDLSAIVSLVSKEKETKEQMQVILDNMPIGVVIWDDKGHILDCNKQILEMLAFQNKNHFIHQLQRGLVGDHIDTLNYRTALKKGKATYEKIYTRNDGELLPVEVTMIKSVRPNDIRVLVYISDLREVKKATTLAQEATELAEIMLNATPLACFLITPAYKALTCNQQAVKLFGFENKHDAIEGFLRIFPSTREDGTPTKLRVLGEEENAQPIHMEYTHQSVTGEKIPCIVTLVSMKYKGQIVIAAFFHDLREMKALAEEVRRVETAEKENRAKTQFLARMSHEIRTPINAIVGVANIALSRKNNVSPELLEWFTQIKHSSDILLALVNDILDLSKIQSGKLEIINKPYDLASLLYDTVQINSIYRDDKNIEVKLLVDENLPVSPIGDEIRIKQVLSNILSNAFKYTEQGTITISAGCTKSDTGIEMHISVKDTGSGMTKKQLKNLFDSEYVRFNENRNVQGTGLGLSITNYLTSLMGGRIEGESEPGAGSTFTVYLPQEVDNWAVLGKEVAGNLSKFQIQRLPKEQKEFVYEYMPYGRVLVVDDIESNLYVAKGLMEPYGLQIETVNRGRKAVDLIKAKNVYDIIFMDHMMPEMDGIETAKEIQALGYEGPIVALTANAILGQSEMFYNNGFAGFISKPIDIGLLNQEILRLVRDKHQEKAKEVQEKVQKEIPQEIPREMPRRRVLPTIDVVAEMRNAFLMDLENVSKTIQELINITHWEENHFKSFVVSAHGIKSALATMKIEALSKDAFELEKAGKERDIETIRKNTHSLLDGLKNVAKTMNDEKNANVSATQEAKDEDKVFLKERLDVFVGACEVYAVQEAEGVLEELKARDWSVGTKELITRLSKLLLHGEFEKIGDLVHESYRER